MSLFLNNFNMNKNELQNAKLQNLGADPTPTAGDKGLVHFNTVSGLTKVWSGTVYDTVTNIIESVSGAGAISVGAVTAKSQAISIAAASGSVPGTMSAADFTKLGAAASINTNSTLVFRDGSGNFAAGTITAALTGTASNAAQLNSQSAAFYLSRTNHTGTQLAATVSDFDTQVRLSRLDQLAAPTAAVALGNQRITGLGTPTAATDAVTKTYVDSLASGLDVHASVRAASTANLAGITYTAAGGTSTRGQITVAPNTLDGVTLAANDRVLVKDQSAGAADGIYVVTTLGTGANGVWDRAGDWDADADVSAGAFTFVEEGTTNADSGWVLATNNPIIVGGASGTALAFTQFSSAAAITAGNGLTKTGNTIDVVGTAARISVAADSIDIDSAYVGQASITTLGTITTGVWTGTAVAVANGGTGGNSAATAKSNLGFKTAFAASIGDGSTTAIAVTHGYTTKDVLVSVQDTASGEEVYPLIVRTSTTVVTLTFSVAPTSNQYRVVVVG